MTQPPIDIVDLAPKVVVIEVDSDICDACPADAKVEALVFVDLRPGTLAFCGHHGTRFLPKLRASGAKIIDRRVFRP